MNTKRVRIKDKKWIRYFLIKIGLIGHSSISKRSMIPAIEECDGVSLGNIGTRDKRSGYSYQDILESDVDVII